MFFHVVRFDFTHLDEQQRQDLERQMFEFLKVPSVVAVRVGPDPYREGFTNMICAIERPEDLPTFRAHPIHDAFGVSIRAANVPPREIIDLETADDASIFSSPKL
jgi:hypothetical protein